MEIHSQLKGLEIKEYLLFPDGEKGWKTIHYCYCTEEGVTGLVIM